MLPVRYPRNCIPICWLNGLTDSEKEALIAFMEAISDQPYRMPRPELPGRNE